MLRDHAPRPSASAKVLGPRPFPRLNPLLLGLTALLGGCGWLRDPEKSSSSAPKPGAGRITIPAGDLPRTQAHEGTVSWPGTDSLVPVRTIEGRRYFAIEGLLDEAAFAGLEVQAGAHSLNRPERDALVAGKVNKTLAAIERKLGVAFKEVSTRASVGYFKAWMPFSESAWAGLARLENLPAGMVVNPLLLEAPGKRDATKLSAEDSFQGVALTTEEHANNAFTGLERIGLSAFLAAAREDLGGVTPDGGNVRVGVADTGITLAHPALSGVGGAPRIVRMRDFTGEGAIYFSPKAKFEISPVPAGRPLPAGVNAKDALLLTAEFLVAPKGTDVPVADAFTSLKDALILVNDELRALLTTPGNPLRLGVLSEEAFGNESAGESVDLNHNGKNSDLLCALYIGDAAQAKARIILSLVPCGGTEYAQRVALPSGATAVFADFRDARGAGDWNLTKQSIPAFAERIGFDISERKLSAAAGEEIPIVTASVVGYDPGNHGTHVAGLIGSRKILANDGDDTLARGAAPAVQFLSARVCSNNGGCTYNEAIVDLVENGAEVVNMSLGGVSPFNDGYAVGDLLINRLTQSANVLFVNSAGNSGPGHQTVGSPSVARLALSIGATASKAMVRKQYQIPGPTAAEDDDFVLYFSSRGPSAAGGFKPNLTAPGTQLSAVQLNAASGQRSGLSVMWGTSMATPTAAGGIALLLDAAKRYNALHPDAPMLVDPASLRNALISSARPFDVSSFNPRTGELSRGRYTWIDQGAGMLNLKAAWMILKAEATQRIPQAVQASVDENAPDGKRVGMPLDFEVRTIAKYRNGRVYDGTDTNQGRTGKGVWLNAGDAHSLVQVGIARRLAPAALKRKDAGDLHRQLVTTADTFVLETVFYGGAKAWMKAGSLGTVECETADPRNTLTLVSEGAVEGASTVAPRDSSLFLCIDRNLVNALAPGDHGALIKAYRSAGGKVEAFASFVVPVYLNVPHGVLASGKGYGFEGSVPSLGVDRNYIEVPHGTTVLKVTLAVPPAQRDGKLLKACSGVQLFAYEGDNSTKPAEIGMGRVSSCNSNGTEGGTRVLSYERANPKPGIWDLHVLGMQQYAQSSYKLTVDFVAIERTLASIEGGPQKLNGKFSLRVKDASLKVALSAENSLYELNGMEQGVMARVEHEGTIKVPDRAGKVVRTYPEHVARVRFSTKGAASGTDIDLRVMECIDDALKSCQQLQTSNGSTDVESLEFSPSPKRFYYGEVMGYEVAGGGTSFDFIEERFLSAPDDGTIAITKKGEAEYEVSYALALEKSKLLALPEVRAGDYTVKGRMLIKGESGVQLAHIPVSIDGKVDAPSQSAQEHLAGAARELP